MKTKGWTLVELMVVIAIIGILASIVVGGAGGCSVSDGSRSGVVTKFSHKGLVNKSWEGEMVMGGTRRSVDGDGNVSAIANVWEFTVMDKAIADKVQQALESGSVVTLKYHQSFGHNPFTRNTSYTVVEVVAK